MGEVSSAVEAILAGVAALQSASVEELTHREIVAEMSRLTTVAWMLPSVEHRLIQRLTAETEPCRLGESSWKKVLTTALRVSGKDATRRLDQAAALGPRRAMTGEPLAPRWEATATAQARGALGAEHVAIIAKFHNQLPGWVDVGTREVADAQLADLAAGWGPEALDKAAAALLMMIDQDGPEPSEKEPARHRSVTMGPQQRDGTRSIRGRLDAQAGAYWEAILAKEAAPGVNNPDDQSGGADDQSGGADNEPGADTGPGERARTDIRTQAQRNHDAFTAVGRRALACGDLGTHNGLPVTVIASATLQDLEKGAGLAVTGGGSFIPIPTLIQMAPRAPTTTCTSTTNTPVNRCISGGPNAWRPRPKNCAALPGAGLHPPRVHRRWLPLPGPPRGRGLEERRPHRHRRPHLRLRTRQPDDRENRLAHPQTQRRPHRMAPTAGPRHRPDQSQQLPPPRALPTPRRRRGSVG